MWIAKLSLLRFVLPHLAYALIVLAAWAWIPKRNLRLLVLALLLVPPAFLVAQVLNALSEGSRIEQSFVGECAKLGEGEIREKVHDVDGIGTEYFVYGTPRSDSATKGNQILGISAWRDVFLGGHNGYQFVEEQLSPGAFQVHQIEGGQLTSSRAQEQRSQWDIGWQPLSTQVPPRIEGLQLQILNRSTKSVIASRTVLRLNLPYVTLPGTPVILRPNIARVCPRQIELVNFIKTVAAPAPHPF